MLTFERLMLVEYHPTE